jgi:hypothetical protein
MFRIVFFKKTPKKDNSSTFKQTINYRQSLAENKEAKDSAREQIRRLQAQLNGLMEGLASPPVHV